MNEKGLLLVDVAHASCSNSFWSQTLPLVIVRGNQTVHSPSRGGGTPIKQGQGCLPHLLWIKKVVFGNSKGVQCQSPQWELFAVPFRVLSWTNVTGDNVLFWNSYLLEVKKPHPQNRILVPHIGVLFIWELPPP